MREHTTRCRGRHVAPRALSATSTVAGLARSC